MKTTNQATFEHIISKPRLHRYSSYFALSNVQEAIGLYLWNAELTMNFSVLLGFFEVALRNSIHHAFIADQSHLAIIGMTKASSISNQKQC